MSVPNSNMSLPSHWSSGHHSSSRECCHRLDSTKGRGRRACLPYSWLSLRSKTRIGFWVRIVVGILAVYLFFDFGIPQINRLDLYWGITLFDLGLYGFMPLRYYKTFPYGSPNLEFLVKNDRCSQDNIIFAPRGPMVRNPGGVILDYTGELVYRQSGFDGDTQDLRVQTYMGEHFLTFWVGEESEGQKKGVWYMMDETYTVRHQIHCKNGLSCDMHEFQITPEGTALLAMYSPKRADLRPVGGVESGWILDCRFQEIDIATGDLLFEWIASDHYSVADSFRTLDYCSNDASRVFDGCGRYKSTGYDFYHINSLEKDELGNYLVSARNTHTISYIDGRTGDVIWTLGGRQNSFEDLSGGAATNFSFQHHARWQDNHTISLLDNAFHFYHDPQDHESRAMMVQLDTDERTATLRAEYLHPAHMRTQSQGNAQLLDSGNLFVGWGRCAAFSEFSPEGELLCDAHFGASAFYSFGPVSSYRVVRGVWTGRPKEPPSVLIEGESLYVSWNGATEVNEWWVEGTNEPPGTDLHEDDTHDGDQAVYDGQDDDRWEVLMQVSKTGFETEIEVPQISDFSYVRVVAIGKEHDMLGASEPLATTNGFGSVLLSRGLTFVLSIVGVLMAITAIILVLTKYRYLRLRPLWHRSRKGYKLLAASEPTLVVEDVVGMRDMRPEQTSWGS